MGNLRSSFVATLISGLVAGGCQSAGSTTIAEYRPHSNLIEHKAPASEVLQLVRWTPIAPLAKPATTNPAAKQMPVEVEQVYVARGRRVGFRREGGQLVAVADQTTTPLEEAHYEWKTFPGEESDQAAAARRRSEAVYGTIGLVSAAVLVVTIWLVIQWLNSSS